MKQPIEYDHLDQIITFHQDSLWSHRWQMAPATEQLEKDTVQALKHYRRLLHVLDNTAEFPDPELTPPNYPTLDKATTKEQP